MTKVCDGNPDCPLGDDEKSCVALGDEIDENEVIPYNEEGNYDLSYKYKLKEKVYHAVSFVVFICNKSNVNILIGSQ